MRLGSTVPSGHKNYMLWGCPLCRLHGFFCCGGLTSVGGLVGLFGLPSSWLPGLPGMEPAGNCLVGPGHKAADCRILGSPGASTGSLMDGVRAQAELGPGSWVLGPGCRIPGSQSWCWATGGWGRFPKQLVAESGMFQSLCWPASGQGNGPAGPRAGIGLLVDGLGP